MQKEPYIPQRYPLHLTHPTTERVVTVHSQEEEDRLLIAWGVLEPPAPSEKPKATKAKAPKAKVDKKKASGKKAPEEPETESDDSSDGEPEPPEADDDDSASDPAASE